VSTESLTRSRERKEGPKRKRKGGQGKEKRKEAKEKEGESSKAKSQVVKMGGKARVLSWSTPHITLSPDLYTWALHFSRLGGRASGLPEAVTDRITLIALTEEKCNRANPRSLM
jgi:hypothetical protein